MKAPPNQPMQPETITKDRSEETSNGTRSSFAKKADQPKIGLLHEFIEFLSTNKKWWLSPIVIVLLVLSFFVLLTNTAVGPFIYVLF